MYPVHGRTRAFGFPPFARPGDELTALLLLTLPHRRAPGAARLPQQLEQLRLRQQVPDQPGAAQDTDRAGREGETRSRSPKKPGPFVLRVRGSTSGWGEGGGD